MKQKQFAIKKYIKKKPLGINVKVQQLKLKFNKRVGNKVKKIFQKKEKIEKNEKLDREVIEGARYWKNAKSSYCKNKVLKTSKLA